HEEIFSAEIKVTNNNYFDGRRGRRMDLSCIFTHAPPPHIACAHWIAEHTREVEPSPRGSLAKIFKNFQRVRSLDSSMQQCVRVDRTLEKGLADSGSMTLLVVCDRELIELILQSHKFSIEVGSLTCKLSAGLPLGTHEAKHKAAP